MIIYYALLMDRIRIEGFLREEQLHPNQSILFAESDYFLSEFYPIHGKPIKVCSIDLISSSWWNRTSQTSFSSSPPRPKKEKKSVLPVFRPRAKPAHGLY